jgi:hypothetical protein
LTKFSSGNILGFILKTIFKIALFESFKDNHLWLQGLCATRRKSNAARAIRKKDKPAKNARCSVSWAFSRRGICYVIYQYAVV